MSEGKKIKRRAKKEERSVSLVDFEQTPNTQKFIEQIKTLCSAACGVIMVRTAEEHRAILSIAEFAASKRNTEMLVWRISDGWVKINTEETPQTATPSVPSSLHVNSGFGQASHVVAGTADFETAQDGEVDPDDDTITREIELTLYPVEERQNDWKIYDPMNALDWLTSPDGHYAKLNERVPTNRPIRDGDPEKKDAIYVMTYPDPFLIDPGVQEAIKRFATLALDDDIRLFLVCSNAAEVPERIYEDVRTVEFLPPNPAELLAELENALENYTVDDDDDPTDFDLSDEDKQKVVRNALGLSVGEFVNAVSIALVRQQDTEDEIDVSSLISTVREAKLEMLKKNPILEYKEPVPIEMVGGLDLLKKYIHKRRKAFSAEARSFGVDPPKGILIVGAPGTGKSLFAKVTSSVLDIPLLLLDIGKVFGGLVGQSEGQMRSALKTVDAMSPCVLLIDEVDKGFSNTSGGGDSGTSARVFGTFLTWMQERDSANAPVFVVFTANNANHLPPELVRKGRVDDIFHAPFPNVRGRMDTLRIHLDKRGHEMDDEDLHAVALATDGFSGSELEAVVKEAIMDAFDAEEDTVNLKHMIEIAEGITPLKRMYPKRVEEMDEWAKLNAKAASSAEEDAIAPKSSVATVTKPGVQRRSIKKIKGKTARN